MFNLPDRFLIPPFFLLRQPLVCGWRTRQLSVLDLKRQSGLCGVCVRVCVPSAFLWTLAMRGNAVLYGWDKTRTQSGQHGDHDPLSVMECMPSFWSPHLALPLRGVPSPKHMFSPAICLALLLLCLFIKNVVGRRWLSWAVLG